MLKYNIYLPVGTSTHFVNADLVLTLLNCTLKVLERQIRSVILLEADFCILLQQLGLEEMLFDNNFKNISYEAFLL